MSRRTPPKATEAAAVKECDAALDEYMNDYWNTLCELFELDPKEHPYRAGKTGRRKSK